MQKKEERYHSLRYQGTFDKDNGGGAKGRRGVGKEEAVPLSTSLEVLLHTLPTGSVIRSASPHTSYWESFEIKC